MPEPTYISAESARRITIVSVTGLPDAKAAGWALALSQAQMPGCRALLCSPVRPADLPLSVEHRAIAPMDYQGYSWFMLFMLWRGSRATVRWSVRTMAGCWMEGFSLRSRKLMRVFAENPALRVEVSAPDWFS